MKVNKKLIKNLYIYIYMGIERVTGSAINKCCRRLVLLEGCESIYVENFLQGMGKKTVYVLDKNCYALVSKCDVDPECETTNLSMLEYIFTSVGSRCEGLGGRMLDIIMKDATVATCSISDGFSSILKSRGFTCRDSIWRRYRDVCVSLYPDEYVDNTISVC